ncbi:hypothetical protein SDC9_116667 [bioreactor metagenome]|uniref:Uncharacterized protein n=1 Tax=bioreactor metagenome TaxID=1076179 RepID=A0A645BWD7_9ZZZZ
MHGDALAARVLDAAQVQDLRATRREFQHLVVADLRELTGSVDDARICGEDAVHIGVDLADLGAQGRGERHRGGVGGSASQSRDVLGGLRDTLEAGHDNDVAVLQ